MSDTYKYDVGIICTEEDDEFAKTLIEKVERIFGKNVFYKLRDAGSGYKTDISLKMFAECERIFAICSEHSNESTIYEGNLALQKYCKENKKSNRQRIVPLIIDTKGTCPEFLDVSEVIRFPDNKYFWDRIRTTLEEKIQLGETGGQGDGDDGDGRPDGKPREPLLSQPLDNAEASQSSGNDQQDTVDHGDFVIELKSSQSQDGNGCLIKLKKNYRFVIACTVMVTLGAITVTLWLFQISLLVLNSCTPSLQRLTHAYLTITYFATTVGGMISAGFVYYYSHKRQKMQKVQLGCMELGPLICSFTVLGIVELAGCFDHHDVQEPTIEPVSNHTIFPLEDVS